MTHQRQVILEEVRRSHNHPTADEIYERVRKKLPRISMGTVYRNLDILSACGLIEKLEPGRTQMRFDGRVQDHYHMTCARCGRIEDIPISPSDNPIERLESVMGNLTKYGVFGHKLEFVGLCPDCTKQGDTTKEKETQDD
jgi:Fur family ferric uptake transcriptional regulator